MRRQGNPEPEPPARAQARRTASNTVSGAISRRHLLSNGHSASWPKAQGAQPVRLCSVVTEGPRAIHS